MLQGGVLPTSSPPSAGCAACSASAEALGGLGWLMQSLAGTDGLQEFAFILFFFFLPFIAVSAEDLAAVFKMSSFPNSSLKTPDEMANSPPA